MPAVLQNIGMNSGIISTLNWTLLIVQFGDRQTQTQTATHTPSLLLSCPRLFLILSWTWTCLQYTTGTKKKTGAFYAFHLLRLGELCSHKHRLVPAHSHTNTHTQRLTQRVGLVSPWVSSPYCCANEKFTQNWSHRLFWARLWPRSALKSLHPPLPPFWCLSLLLTRLRGSTDVEGRLLVHNVGPAFNDCCAV